MNDTMLIYAGISLLSVFISAISQVILKTAAMREYDSHIREYLNVRVIIAYSLFVGTTFLSILAYRGIPLSMGPILESTSYIYVTIFGVLLFRENINRRKIMALLLIVLGIVIYSLG